MISPITIQVTLKNPIRAKIEVWTLSKHLQQLKQQGMIVIISSAKKVEQPSIQSQLLKVKLTLATNVSAQIESSL